MTQSSTAIAHGRRGGRCNTGRDNMCGVAQAMPSHAGRNDIPYDEIG